MEQLNKAIENYIYGNYNNRKGLLSFLCNNCQHCQITDEDYSPNIHFEDKEGKREDLKHGFMSIKSDTIPNNCDFNYIAIIEMVLDIEESRIKNASELDENDIIGVLNIYEDLNMFSRQLEEFLLRGNLINFDLKELKDKEDFQYFSNADNTVTIKKTDPKFEIKFLGAVGDMRKHLTRHNEINGSEAELMLISNIDKREYLKNFTNFKEWKWIYINDPKLYCLLKYWSLAKNKKEKFHIKLIRYPLKLFRDNESRLFHLFWFGAIKFEYENTVRCINIDD